MSVLQESQSFCLGARVEVLHRRGAPRLGDMLMSLVVADNFSFDRQNAMNATPY